MAVPTNERFTQQIVAPTKLPRISAECHSRMTDATPLPFDLPSVCRKKPTVDFNGGKQSSDGGLLLLRQAERNLGVCWRLAGAMADHRMPGRAIR
jgi:hypothetical protein